jgi:hypothetical protein
MPPTSSLHKICRCCSLCSWYTTYRRAVAKSPEREEVMEGAVCLNIYLTCQSRCGVTLYPNIFVPDARLDVLPEEQTEEFIKALYGTTNLQHVEATILESSDVSWGMRNLALLPQIPHLQSLCIDSLVNIRMDQLASLLHQITHLQCLEINYNADHVDFTDLVFALTSHEYLEKFVLYYQGNPEAELTHSSNPTLDILGEALLKVRKLKVLQFGRKQEDADMLTVPFSPELLSALVQHATLQELNFYHCILSDEQCHGLAVGLEEGCPAFEHVDWRDQTVDLSDNAFLAMDLDDGLERLALCGTKLSDAGYAALIAALQRHPSIRCLDLEHTFPDRGTMNSIQEWEKFNERKRYRTQLIVNMLQDNCVLHSVLFTLSERDEELMQKLNFWLDLNKLGLRRLRTGMSRGVWGMAAVALRKDPSKLFALLQQRPDLVVPCRRMLSSQSTKSSRAVSRIQQAVTRNTVIKRTEDKGSEKRFKSILSLFSACLKGKQSTIEPDMTGKLLL